MELTITPELEGIIQRELDSGRYETPQQVFENAVYKLEHDHHALGMTLAEFQAKLDEGWEEAERGETVSAEDARAYLAKARAERNRA